MCRINRRHPMMGQWILTSRLRCSRLSSLSSLCGHHINGWLGFSSSSSQVGRRRLHGRPRRCGRSTRHRRHRRRARELCCMDLLCTTFMDLFELDLYELVWTRPVLVVVDERNKTLFVCVYQMPVMLIRIHGIIIMIYMIFWGYHIRNNQTKKLVLAPLPCAKTMAHGKDLNFAVCHVCRAHGKGLTTSSFLGDDFFLLWAESCTRQTLCRVPDI